MKVGVRVAYPEQDGSWFEHLKPYEKVGNIELAFYKPNLFQEIKVKDVIVPFNSLSLKVNSMHMAQERLKNSESFLSILSKTIEIAKNLNCDKIVSDKYSSSLLVMVNNVQGKVRRFRRMSQSAYGNIINACFGNFFDVVQINITGCFQFYIFIKRTCKLDQPG